MASWKTHAIVFWAAFLVVSFLSLGMGLTSTSGLLEEDVSYYFYGSALIILTTVLSVMLIYGSVCMGKIEDKESPDLDELASSLWKKLLSPTLFLVFLITIASAAIPSSGWFLSTHHDINAISALEVLLGSTISVIFAAVVLFSIRKEIRNVNS